MRASRAVPTRRFVGTALRAFAHPTCPRCSRPRRPGRRLLPRSRPHADHCERRRGRLRPLCAHRAPCPRVVSWARRFAPLPTLLVLAAPARADPVEDFYRGRDLTLIIASGVAGGYDPYARIARRAHASFRGHGASRLCPPYLSSLLPPAP